MIIYVQFCYNNLYNQLITVKILQKLYIYSVQNITRNDTINGGSENRKICELKYLDLQTDIVTYRKTKLYRISDIKKLS